MRCAAYCVSESYDFAKLHSHLSEIGFPPIACDRDSLYIKMSSSSERSLGDVFIFKYGCVIFWGFNPEDEHRFLAEIAPLQHNTNIEVQIDTCYFVVRGGQETNIEEENDLIILEADDDKIKLSMSYGLSQSVKLAVFENSVDIAINKNKDLPDMLIKTGKILLSRRKLAKKIGHLFVERNSVNLHSTILDTPDFFWRQPRYEAYYNMAIEFLDKDRRIEILNKRLDVMHELYEILSAELQHLHSSRLEWIIIILIMIEVLLSILRDFFGN